MGGAKSMKRSGYKIALSVMVVSIMVACQSGGHEEVKSQMHHSLMESLPDQAPDTVVYDQEMEALMDDLKKALVDLRVEEPEASDEEKMQVPSKETYVLTRKEDITSFPCSNCHTGDLEKLQNQQEDAHWHVELKHAGQSVMNCNTCHDLDRPDELKTLAGDYISFDHSYKTCAQCHSSQAKDWLGGAHGKRVRGWVEPRTIYNCVSCHNPHQPKLESRWPARLNTAKILEREE